jgi:hypothetical protein
MGHLKSNIRRRNRLLSPALIQGMQQNYDYTRSWWQFHSGAGSYIHVFKLSRQISA